MLIESPTHGVLVPGAINYKKWERVQPSLIKVGPPREDSLSRKGIQREMGSPRKEMVVGRLKVRVRGLSRSAAHKRIFILGSSVCCERAGGHSTLCCEEGRVTKKEVP